MPFLCFSQPPKKLIMRGYGNTVDAAIESLFRAQESLTEEGLKGVDQACIADNNPMNGLRNNLIGDVSASHNLV